MSSESNRVAVLPGDGIGPEVTRQAVKVMQALATEAGLDLVAEEYPMGGAGLDAAGLPLPTETLKASREAKAVLLGAVGGPKWAKVDFAKRPEAGLLQLRQELGLFANLRPAQIYGDLVSASTLKQEVVEGVDLMVVRELTGGIYFGEPRGTEGTAPNRRGFNTLTYTEPEIERICRVGFEVAQKRRHALCSVDKANVLEVSVLWREIATALQKDYPDVELEHMYVDNAAMQLIRNPRHFDTMVTTNMFGDILSDAAAMLTGSIGMLPSASIGQDYAMYEPVHGSAPDIAGQDQANPLAAILSVGMLFRYTFDLPELDERIRAGVTALLAKYRTPDIQAPGLQPVGCEQMGDLMLEHLAAPAQPITAR